LYFDDKDIANKPIKEVMRAPFPIVKSDTSIDQISKLINSENGAVLVDLGNNEFHIITKHDVIRAIQ
jgi:cystathionine beta-synthase